MTAKQATKIVRDTVNPWAALVVSLIAVLTMVYMAGSMAENVKANTEGRKHHGGAISEHDRQLTKLTEAAKHNAQSAAQINQAVDHLGGLVHRVKAEQEATAREQHALINANKELLNAIRQDLRRR